MSDTLSKITTAILEGNVAESTNWTRAALREGIAAKTILDQGLLPGMDEVGIRFKRGDMFVPEVLISAKAMTVSLELLKPLFQESGVKSEAIVLLGTVQGDLHDIGKNLVGMMLEGAGFEVHDIGRDVAPETFVKHVKEMKPDVVAMSALLTTTMLMMQNTVIALREAGVRDQVKIIVGGAPVTDGFAKKIGADGYAPDAVSAVDVVRGFLGH